MRGARDVKEEEEDDEEEEKEEERKEKNVCARFASYCFAHLKTFDFGCIF